MLLAPDLKNEWITIEPVFHCETSNFWSQFSLALCSWGHFTPWASWVPVALLSLTWADHRGHVSMGTVRTTRHSHRKDSFPKQWNWAFQSWSLPSAPFGVEMATPQQSWLQITLALARLQWGRHRALSIVQKYSSPPAPHTERSRFSWAELLCMLVGKDKISTKSHVFSP